jgi:PAS domain-containing protein
MSSKDSYHVLLSCASRSDADYFSNLLRAHADGAAIRTREVGTLAELRERLADPTWEVLVATDGEAELTAANVLTAAGEAGMPVLFCTTRLDAAQVDALLADGAVAVLRRDQGKRLFHAVQREVGALRDRRALESLRPRHQELERRCELLLETSSEALAYATDGMHLHCNHAYARLFGFNDPIDLQSVTQLDLVVPGAPAALSPVVAQLSQRIAGQHRDRTRTEAQRRQPLLCQAEDLAHPLRGRTLHAGAGIRRFTRRHRTRRSAHAPW